MGNSVTDKVEVILEDQGYVPTEGFGENQAALCEAFKADETKDDLSALGQRMKYTRQRIITLTESGQSGEAP